MPLANKTWLNGAAQHGLCENAQQAPNRRTLDKRDSVTYMTPRKQEF
jgi:hypothetical protein